MRLCAYDISVDACKALERRSTSADVGSGRLLITPHIDAARSAGPYDLVISLFGVMSHIEESQDRIDALTSMRSMLTGDGRLLLTVPNAVRRFPLHTSSAGQGSDGRNESSVRARTRRYYPSARLVTYRHNLENAQRPFPYYLYSRRQLAGELAAAVAGLDHHRVGDHRGDEPRRDLRQTYQAPRSTSEHLTRPSPVRPVRRYPLSPQPSATR
jgi:hypothetical protein